MLVHKGRIKIQKRKLWINTFCRELSLYILFYVPVSEVNIAYPNTLFNLRCTYLDYNRQNSTDSSRKKFLNSCPSKTIIKLIYTP